MQKLITAPFDKTFAPLQTRMIGSQYQITSLAYSIEQFLNSRVKQA